MTRRDDRGAVRSGIRGRRTMLDTFVAEQQNDPLSALPAAVAARAREMYAEVAGRPDAVGATDSVEGYLIETHTLGCRDAADDPEEEWWERHWAIYDEYAGDGISVLAGDPSDGIFVSVTPEKTFEERKIEPQNRSLLTTAGSKAHQKAKDAPPGTPEWFRA
jgi:hypothetical protein